jgi:hypothetical protein
MRNHLTNTVEILYLSRMLRWECTAPPDRHKGFLDGVPEFNSQTARLAYVVKLIAAGTEDKVYSTFERLTRRDDGHSYISRDASWMNSPCSLSSGWHFEGCTSLEQKQQCIRSVIQLGLSPLFERCFDDFVAGRSVVDYMPTLEEQEVILERLRERGELVDFEDGQTTPLIE